MDPLLQIDPLMAIVFTPKGMKQVLDLSPAD